jgi:hypothetical protein
MEEKKQSYVGVFSCWSYSKLTCMVLSISGGITINLLKRTLALLRIAALLEVHSDLCRYSYVSFRVPNKLLLSCWVNIRICTWFLFLGNVGGNETNSSSSSARRRMWLWIQMSCAILWWLLREYFFKKP